ncbi:uncharacterized protein LOC125179175 [Hyalella azteca]|uniref:Uncharacterized protein LOC125179175 n=1 Tax=Hyalella azteca TaxID=294128 RepID=A0A979FWY9_HYAAZ|nr:uncharacterized protein LOC125179175 [Hyalella azteca]
MNSFFTSVRSMLSPKKSLPNESRNEENNELPERIPNEEAEGHRQSSRKKKFRSFTGKRSLKNKSSLRPSNTNLQDQSHSNSPAYEGKFLPRYGTLPSRTHPNLNSQGRPQTISKGHSMSPGTKMPCENGWDKIFQDPRYPSTVSGNSVVERPVFRETSVNLPQRSALRPEDSRRQTRYGKKPDILELLSKNSCYHGTMSREAADRLLQREAEDGCYLVRRSTQRHRRLVLSMYSEGLTYHFAIEMYSEGLTYNFAIECTGDDRLQLERSNRAFESLDKLLSHYQRRAIIKGCYLSSPVVQTITDPIPGL